MAFAARVKEEFYLRRAFDGDAPVFVDATRYARQGLPYPLSAKKALKATCAVWTDDKVVAFSLRHYTAQQTEREVEHLESGIGAHVITYQNVLRPRMPRKTLQDLNEAARELSPVIGDDVIVELDGELHVLALTRMGGTAELRPAGRIVKAGVGDAYVRSETVAADGEFTLPIRGLRLRIFLRSPVRGRVIAYGFGGYLARRPGEVETVVRATALALNSLLGLATFRLLSGLHHVEVPPRPGAAIRQRGESGRVAFTVPVLLCTGDGTQAASGRLAGEIDLEHVDPVTGGLRVRLSGSDRLAWNPTLIGSVRFETYERVLTESIVKALRSSLGDAIRAMTYDIVLGDLGEPEIARLRAAANRLPRLTASG
ncbi:hypothetical protein [Actinomadura sp. 3N407]|uniref:hypothetical protein n=1 Tax=Actinomadura sp. 3N407 TaxID=3457423 RepID=UPI003FCC3D00